MLVRRHHEACGINSQADKKRPCGANYECRKFLPLATCNLSVALCLRYQKTFAFTEVSGWV